MIQNEIFGPVITVQQFTDEAQALEWANGVDVRPRLVACGRRTTAAPCAWPRALDFGCVWINTHIPIVAEMPHGGFKQSGYGKDLSHVRLRRLHAHQARDGEHRGVASETVGGLPRLQRQASRAAGAHGDAARQ